MDRFKFLLATGIVLLLLTNVSAQDNIVKGLIIDNAGMPVSGATIKLKNFQIATVSDTSGGFSIKAPENGVLEVNLMGFKKREINIDGKSSLNILLEPSEISLSEVVVVGYGTQKKENLTGSVTQISGEDLINKAAPNVLAALQGEMPGVVISQTSGQPGEEGLEMTVRGHSSVNSVAPLVLIDGIEGDLQTINPADIESISVLKDASSASIFGAKAAGGVVLVKTKTGENTGGVTTISYNGQHTVAKQGRRPERLDSWDELAIHYYSRGINMSAQETNFLKSPNLNALIASKTSMDYYDNTNWLKVGLNDYSNQKRHSLNVRGGTTPLNYMLSFGYHDNDGFMKYGPDGVKAYNVRLNLNSQVNRNIALFVSASNNYMDLKDNAYGNKFLMNLMYRNRTRGSVYYPVDEDPLPNPNDFAGGLSANIVELQKRGGLQQRLNNDFSAQGRMRIGNFKNFENLEFDLTASRRTRTNKTDRFTNQITWYTRGGGSPQRISRSNPDNLFKLRDIIHSDKFIATGNYSLSLNEVHDFALMAGAEYFSHRLDRIIAEKSYVPSATPSLNYGEAATAVSSDAIETEKTFSSFGRLNYAFKNKYLFEANIRNDGSSRLAPEYRWKTYGSVSAGWVISNESFFKNNLKTFNIFKLRGSFGRLGNSVLLGYYDYQTLISAGRTIFGGKPVNTYYLNTLPSRQITWESIEVANIGLDITLLSNKLEFVGDIYRKKNTNMLSAEVNIPSMIGVGVSSTNSGELVTNGWEFEIKWRDELGDVKYWTSFNLSDSKNKLTKYSDANVINEGLTDLLEGYPLNTIWGYKTDGLFQSTPNDDDKLNQIGGAVTGIGDVRYVNLDEDSQINGGLYTKENHGDLVYYGTADPRYTFGFNLGGEYKQFGFSLFLQGVGRRLFMLDDNTLNPTAGTLYQAMDFHNDYWTVDNPDALFPRPYYQAGGYNYRSADRWIQNAAYLRVKEVRLSYKIPALQKKLKQFELHLSGQNLYEFTNVWGAFDPEAPNLAGAFNWYAYNRSITIGMNVRF